MGQTVSFKRPDGKSVQAYLAEPAGGAQAPGLVVIQEWWGLNDQIRGVADRLAAAGVDVKPELSLRILDPAVPPSTRSKRTPGSHRALHASAQAGNSERIAAASLAKRSTIARDIGTWASIGCSPGARTRTSKYPSRMR